MRTCTHHLVSCPAVSDGHVAVVVLDDFVVVVFVVVVVVDFALLLPLSLLLSLCSFSWLFTVI